MHTAPYRHSLTSPGSWHPPAHLCLSVFSCVLPVCTLHVVSPRDRWLCVLPRWRLNVNVNVKERSSARRARLLLYTQIARRSHARTRVVRFCARARVRLTRGAPSLACTGWCHSWCTRRCRRYHNLRISIEPTNQQSMDTRMLACTACYSTLSGRMCVMSLRSGSLAAHRCSCGQTILIAPKYGVWISSSQLRHSIAQQDMKESICGKSMQECQIRPNALT